MTGQSVRLRDLDIPISGTLRRILTDLKRHDGYGLIVGGAVRDALLGNPPKDLDVECYGFSYDTLTQLLSCYGQVDLVGRSFGVIKLTDPEGLEYDFSVPRRDSKVGAGHGGILSMMDSSMTPYDASLRRDFTWNSMAFDPLTREMHDYHKGEKDLNDRIIRHTSDAFGEDALRVLRGMQFFSRLTTKQCEKCGSKMQEADE